MLTEKIFINAFNLVGNIGSVSFKKISSNFSSMESAWQASEQKLKDAGLDEKIVADIISKRKDIDPKIEFKKLAKNEINIITIKDAEYPQQLKEIHNPPIALYVSGNIKPEDKFSLGVVGSRKPSIYGKQVVAQIVADLVEKGLTIVSGLAYGIDAIAHRNSIENKGRTLAIIGSGLDRDSLYPSENYNLARQIIEKNAGAVISEYPIGTPAFKQHFPMRNRIISGLSLGVIIIEAAEKSGALITAQHAIDQNREVFAIPGSIYSQNSIGPNKLIQAGAKLVLTANDIFEELNLEIISARKQTIEFETKEENLIFNALSGESTHIDKIVNLTKLDTAMVSANLTIMEIKGIIKNIGGMNYIKIN